MNKLMSQQLKINNLLYTKNNQIVDEPFTLPLKIWDKKFIEEGEAEVWCLGPVNVGDYLCSSYLNGIAMVTNLEEVSFGVALSELPNKLEIGKVKFKFLNKEVRDGNL